LSGEGEFELEKRERSGLRDPFAFSLCRVSTFIGVGTSIARLIDYVNRTRKILHVAGVTVSIELKPMSYRFEVVLHPTALHP